MRLQADIWGIGVCMVLVLDCGADERVRVLLRNPNATIFHLAQSQANVLQQVAQRIGNLEAANILIKTLLIAPAARPTALEILAVVEKVGTDIQARTGPTVFKIA